MLKSHDTDPTNASPVKSFASPSHLLHKYQPASKPALSPVVVERVEDPRRFKAEDARSGRHHVVIAHQRQRNTGHGETDTAMDIKNMKNLFFNSNEIFNEIAKFIY
jgi:hypothetical protein